MLGVLAVLAFSPIVWQHYLVLILVPLAVLRPSFSGVWLVPLLLWFTPVSASIASLRELVMFAVVMVAVSAWGLAGGRDWSRRDLDSAWRASSLPLPHLPARMA